MFLYCRVLRHGKDERYDLRDFHRAKSFSSAVYPDLIIATLTSPSLRAQSEVRSEKVQDIAGE